LVLSLIAMAFMLFGIVLLYAATGTMDLYEQGSKIKEILVSHFDLLSLGFIFVLVGAAFKMSLFPFHIWAPEVYQGSSLFIVSYMVVIVKGVVLFFLLRCFFLLFSVEETLLTTIISFMAILSMWIGNGLMLVEKNFMRLLAFLSIAHLGYLMIPLLARNMLGVEAIFLDIAAFGFAILMILITIKMLPNRFSSSFSHDNFKGLVKEHPRHAFALIISLISIVGFPLTAGFVGKYAIFASGIDAKLWHLTMHMVLSSILGLFALVKIVVSMFENPKIPIFEHAVAKERYPRHGVLLVGALVLLAFGIFPQAWISWAKEHVADLGYVHDLSNARD
jgi:NADH-quinone oxidoreductase subunit N